MRIRNRLLLVGLLLVIVSMGVVWAVVRPRDPIFHGKPETLWIEQLAYNDTEQVKQWREFGPDGVGVLVRALEGASRPADRFYRSAVRRMSQVLPGGVLGLLPAPREDATRITRMKVVDLLSSLRKDVHAAVPAMAQALKDEDDSVQALAITFFTSTEDEDALLNQLPALQKRKLLPEFIRALGSVSHWGLRNNAALALKYFPDEPEVVLSALTNALNDPMPQVRIVAAGSLHRVAPDAAAADRVVSVVIGILRNSDDQIAHRAAELLGKIGKASALTVPALIESVQGTNRLVASAAASALGSFPDQAEKIVPVLLHAYQNTNGVVSRRMSGRALKKLAPEAAVSLGL
ncbi:MAG: HEAT repeat domain-containing protein [Verrucomicrobiales bacterium]|nr:HEAT repeat domain-containing protein [Verrucomicrobiales bacterium]